MNKLIKIKLKLIDFISKLWNYSKYEYEYCNIYIDLINDFNDSIIYAFAYNKNINSNEFIKMILNTSKKSIYDLSDDEYMKLFIKYINNQTIPSFKDNEIFIIRRIEEQKYNLDKSYKFNFYNVKNQLNNLLKNIKI